ncbi:MAG TPA: very short patch repair endonuclease [Cytophagaceae bacterium]|jgi:DNA mismatch endonuclease (patch repair protein)|nr:very short patch repair endonuclease [Cytophagaceae bacterium]
MGDVHNKEVRSYNMSRIRGKNTKPELIVRKFLWDKGFRYRLHVKKLPGSPDIVLYKHNTIIFVQGCFWHGHEGCKYFKIPKTRKEWWSNKITKTKELDNKNKNILELNKWKVIEIWECELKSKDPETYLNSLIEKIIS